MLIVDSKGVIVDLVNAKEAGDNVEFYDGIISPGFINCHCHLELSHLKGKIPKHTGLIDFLLKIVEQRFVDDETIQNAIQQAEVEMIQNGIVAVGDICNTNHTVEQKRRGQIFYQNFLEVSGFPKSIANQRFEQIKKTFDEFSIHLNQNSIVPHAPYSVSTDLIKLIMEFQSNEIVTMHNQETIEENEFFKFKSGDFLRLYDQLKINIDSFTSQEKNSIVHFAPYFNREINNILVHNVCTNKEDIDFLKEQYRSDFDRLYFCLCPNANQYISNQMPSADLFLNENCNIVLGTDSLASNDELSIFSEIKTLQKSNPQFSTTQLLKWATINGAKALKIDHLFGSFEKGKKPGVILIKGDKVEVLVKA